MEVKKEETESALNEEKRNENLNSEMSDTQKSLVTNNENGVQEEPRVLDQQNANGDTETNHEAGEKMVVDSNSKTINGETENSTATGNSENTNNQTSNTNEENMETQSEASGSDLVSTNVETNDASKETSNQTNTEIKKEDVNMSDEQNIKNQSENTNSQNETQDVKNETETIIGEKEEKAEEDKFTKQKHAMDFLYKVRCQYLKSPSVYNQFLEIMKNFKNGMIDTPLVIKKVRELFKGNGYLIEEFNAFLPPGYKIDSQGNTISSGLDTSSQNVDQENENEGEQENENDSQGVENEKQGNVNANVNHNLIPVTTNGGLGLAPPPTTDLEHARNYVRKIKNRFSLQPHIYKTFLEILHAYYQGQHSINDVLEEVADLFQNHADLLEEFKHFLPKSIGEQQQSAMNAVASHADGKAKKGNNKRKEREREEDILERDRSKMRLSENERRKRDSQNSQNAQPNINVYSKPTRRINREEASLTYDTNRLTRRRTTNNSAVNMDGIGISNGVGLGVSSGIGISNTYNNNYNSNIAHAELMFLNNLRENLPSNLYQNFLRVIVLFSQEILTKSELVQMAQDILMEEDLYDAFRQFIAYEGKDVLDKFLPDKLKMNYSEYMKLVEDKENEDEDEKCELEVMIELNNYTIRALDSVYEQIEMTNVKPDFSILDGLHLRTIERLYGERSGDILELLTSAPKAVLPVVLKRLRQRNVTWNLQKQDLLHHMK